MITGAKRLKDMKKLFRGMIEGDKKKDDSDTDSSSAEHFSIYRWFLGLPTAQ